MTSKERKPICIEERGASLAEYGLLAGLIAVVAIAAVSQVGNKVSSVFDEATAELELAQLIATAERVHYLPGDEVFPAQKCFVGTSGADNLSAADGADANDTDCLDGAGGPDSFTLASADPRDILVYLRQQGQDVSLPAGNHVLVASPILTGPTSVTVAGGSSTFDLRPMARADFEIAPSSATDLEMVYSGGSITISDQFPDEEVTRFFFSDGEFSAADIRQIAVTEQATPNADDIMGTFMDDTIAPLSGNDYIFHNQGDDTIIYSAGEDTVFGDQGTGFDTLDLTKYTRSQVTFADDWGGSAITITTPDGFVRLTQQNSYPVGDPNVNIEQVLFSDQTLTDQELRDLSN